MIKVKAGGMLDLSEVEVGDQLMVCSGGFGACRYRKVGVIKVSPNRIRTSDNNYWMRKSHKLVGSGSSWSAPHIMPVDEARIAEAAARDYKLKLVQPLSREMFLKAGIDQLERIHAILKEGAHAQ